MLCMDNLPKKTAFLLLNTERMIEHGHLSKSRQFEAEVDGKSKHDI